MSWTIHRCGVVGSTMDLARERIAAGTARPREILVAEAQTAGRGRRGRPWLAGWGALLTTSLLPVPELRRDWMALAAALAAAEAMGEFTPAARLKWPNDVVLEGRKSAGILVEVPVGHLAAVGIGINVNNDPQEDGLAPGSATSLRERLGSPVELDAVLAALLRALDRCWALLLAGDVPLLHRRWQQLDATPGLRLRRRADGVRGTALALDDSGGLRVRGDDGQFYVAVLDQIDFIDQG